jgi:hypothetical protein
MHWTSGTPISASLANRDSKKRHRHRGVGGGGYGDGENYRTSLPLVWLGPVLFLRGSNDGAVLAVQIYVPSAYQEKCYGPPDRHGMSTHNPEYDPKTDKRGPQTPAEQIDGCESHRPGPG